MSENAENNEYINPLFFEQVLIKLLFTKELVRDKIMPFINLDVFDDKLNIVILKSILQFEEKFSKFPTFQEMKLYLPDQNTYNRLTEIVNVDLSEYKDEFILELIESWFKSKLINDVNANIAENLSEGNLDEITENVDKLREACAFSFNDKVGLDFFDSEEELYNFLHDKDKVIPSRIIALDKTIDGGFHEKSLTLFMAETNLGKTLIMASLAVNNVMSNKNVLYVTCEMSSKKIAERTLTNFFAVKDDKFALEYLKDLSRNEFHRRFKEMKDFVNSRFVIEEYPPRTINANHIRNLLKNLKMKKKFIPDIIYVDYVEILTAIRNYKGDNSYSEIKRISEELRAVAVEYGIPIVSAVQTNRDGYDSEDLEITNISQSIGTAATADIVIGVTQNDEDRNAGRYWWKILKNRYGLNKKKFKVGVDYYKMRVFDTDEENGSEVEDMKPIPKSQAQVAKDNQNQVNEAINTVVDVLGDELGIQKDKLLDDNADFSGVDFS